MITEEQQASIDSLVLDIPKKMKLVDSRKAISKILAASNLLAMTSRRGPAQSIIFKGSLAKRVLDSMPEFAPGFQNPKNGEKSKDGGQLKFTYYGMEVSYEESDENLISVTRAAEQGFKFEEVKKPSKKKRLGSTPDEVTQLNLKITDEVQPTPRIDIQLNEVEMTPDRLSLGAAMQRAAMDATSDYLKEKASEGYTEVVANGQVATFVQDIAGFIPEPNANTIPAVAGTVYPLGKINDLQVMVNPNLKWTDNQMVFQNENLPDYHTDVSGIDKLL